MTRFLLLLALAGCNVTAAEPTGGADLPERGACPRGLAVVTSDYLSTEIALLAPDATVVSPAFLSSASTAASGLAAPLSGDVTIAKSTTDNELVTVDRFGTNVLTFVDARAAEVRAQLPVGTGFEANAQDYLEIDSRRAFVPRLGQNSRPGREAFDGGSDVLVVDPSVPRIDAAIAMPVEAGYRPNPAAIMRLGSYALVTLHHARADFSASADSELVAISVADLEVAYRLDLMGLVNCGRAELSPSRELLALACSGHLDRTGVVAEPETSGIVLFDATTTPPQELRRIAALEVLGTPFQSSLEFVTDSLVLIKTQTPLGADADNQLFSLDLDSGRTELLATAARGPGGAGFGIAFGGMYCGVSCGDPCLVCDRSRGKLLRFDVRKSELDRGDDITIDGAGLPPGAIVPFW